uniref:Uncharacterized protein n=1 Tax=Octopus bimaculoides TaxID=37653 RepID=A0A0L8IHK1_OCTBM
MLLPATLAAILVVLVCQFAVLEPTPPSSSSSIVSCSASSSPGLLFLPWEALSAPKYLVVEPKVIMYLG